MKNYLNHLSLAQKLTFLTLLITIACSAAIMGCVYYFILHLSDDNLSEELKTRQSFIQKAYIEPLSKVDKVQISEVSQSLLLKNGYSYVAAIRVVDSNENVLYLDSTFENKQSSIESYAKLPFTKMGVSEIRKEGKLLGRVSVVFTSEAKMKKYQGILSGIFLASSLFVVFTCVWIYFFFNNILTYPLNKLLEHVKQLKSENYETRDYADIPHELELIGNTLNYASSLIKKRNDDFKHHSEDLEKMVEDRTCELENQILRNVKASRLVALGELASGIAHEINNPLAVINGQVMKIKKQVQSRTDRSEIEAPLAKINLMIDRIVKIINGLKLISRDGNRDPMAAFSLNGMIEEIKLLSEMKIKSMNVDFSITNTNPEDIVYGREVQLSQVLVNLINNSVDAISKLEERWIRVDIFQFADQLHFTVTDSGKGIPKELQDKIMNPFFTTKEVGKGTGLGLSISMGIIKEHGGEFYYNDNHPNTQFVFTISNQATKQKAA